jgi:hypothetical protein
VKRIHPDRVTRRLDGGCAASSGSLEDAELRLQLRGVATEGVERFADAVGVVATAGRLRDVLEPR